MNMTLNMASADDARSARTGLTRIGYVEGAIGGPDRVASLAALFPQVQFVSVGATWPPRALPGLGAMIVSVSASDAEEAQRRLTSRPGGVPIIVVLRDADVAASRRLMSAGAADILIAPVQEAALAMSLERMLVTIASQSDRAPAGKIVALLKAGGGVGATAVGVQLAAMIASHGDAGGGVCFADLDVQFGVGALFLDMGASMTLTDVLEGGGPLEDTPLGTALALHRSGARVLAAPRDLMPLEAIGPKQVESLLTALRRDFALTILDMPTSWTAWTNHVLHIVDQIVLITNLSVPHAHLAKAQLKMLAAQRLDTVPLTLVCNRLSVESKAIVSQKAAEKSIGRDFDFVIPEDRAMMNEALAQGCELSSVRTGTKVERAIADLANSIVPTTVAVESKRRWLWQ
jgi:pilus assembly protein CpaE